MLLEAMGRMRKQKQKLWRGISVDLFDQYAEGKTITVLSVCIRLDHSCPRVV